MDAEIKEMFNLMLSKFDDMQNQMDKKFDNMQNQIDKNTHELNEFRQELTHVEQQLTHVEQRINNMQNLLETEIRHNIKIIAEGHGILKQGMYFINIIPVFLCQAFILFVIFKAIINDVNILLILFNSLDFFI